MGGKWSLGHREPVLWLVMKSGAPLGLFVSVQYLGLLFAFEIKNSGKQKTPREWWLREEKSPERQEEEEEEEENLHVQY